MIKNIGSFLAYRKKSRSCCRYPNPTDLKEPLMRICDHSLFMFWLLAISSWVISTNLAGQTLTTGDIVGRVMDSSSAVITHATVVLTNQEKGFSQTSATDTQGAYRFAFLLPGTYIVVA